METLLRIENLTIDFLTGEGDTRAVNNISFTVNKGEMLALVGESGSGKSVTSLSILQLLPKPPARYTSGRIFFKNEGHSAIDLLQLSSAQLSAIRGEKISMIFQEPMSSLNPVLTCGSQVMEALLLHKRLSKAEARERTLHWFTRVRLPDPPALFDRYPHQLSGGQKQRVMIAMAMCCEPSLLICDEPTTALDVTVQKTILELIKDLQQEKNMGVIFITHDLGVVAQIADRVAILYKGDIVEEGSVQEIFRQPNHPYTKALIACRPALHPKGERLPTVSDYMDEEKDLPDRRAAIKELTALGDNKDLIQVTNLSVVFPGKRNFLGKPKSFFTAVDNVSFVVKKGETLGLVGESGCGKTTLGRTLLRLIEPTSGSIFYAGADITKLPKQAVVNLRKEVQLIFQDPYSSLNPRLTISDAIAEPMLVSGVMPSAKDRKKRVAELLEKVSLSPGMMNRYPHQFSGGQRQRIVIARALALSPQFVVCDESVSALDVSVQAQVLNLLNDLKTELGLTLLFISHDLSVVRYMCDRIMVMRAGGIVESGAAEEVYLRPKTGYTRSLIEAIPTVLV